MKWVPISYCQWLIENNATDAGKLFCYAKHHTGGVTPYRELLKRSQRYFGVHERTIRRWLKEAMSYNWIGRSDDTLFIRSWQYLFDTLHFQKKACYKFRKKDLKQFKTFCYAAVMSYMARVQVRELERLSGRSIQVPTWTPLAASAISKTLNVSLRTAQTFRKKAVHAGYIEKKENLKPFHIKVSELSHFRKYSDSGKHLIVKNGKVFEQLPDEIRFNLNLIHSVRRFKKKSQQGTRNSMYAKSVNQSFINSLTQ